MSEDIVERELQELEDARYRAMVSSDLASLERLLADDLIYTHATGLVDTKQQYLESIRSGQLKYLSAERKQDSLRQIGEVVVIQGRLRAHVLKAHQDQLQDSLFLAVWAKRGKHWQLANFAATPIEPV
jgi:Domain of unknown function (DUF4440)